MLLNQEADRIISPYLVDFSRLKSESALFLFWHNAINEIKFYVTSIFLEIIVWNYLSGTVLRIKNESLKTVNLLFIGSFIHFWPN